MNNSSPRYKTKWRRQGILHCNCRINDANRMQQGSKAYFLSRVIGLETVTGKSGVSLVPPSPLGLPLHMLTVITLEPINSCSFGPPFAEGVWAGSRSFLARPLTPPPRQLARVLLLTRKFRTLILQSPFCFVPWSRVLHKGRIFSS